MSNRYNRVTTGDCIRGMRTLADGVVDLAFADHHSTLATSMTSTTTRGLVRNTSSGRAFG